MLKALDKDFDQLIAPKLASQKPWHFNSPHSPYFGALWEVNVKSVKHRLKTVVTDCRLTYEELSTVRINIEHCLNSRNDYIKLNELVLVNDDHYPPPQWLFGRVIDLHPGQDSLVRVELKRIELKQAS